MFASKRFLCLLLVLITFFSYFNILSNKLFYDDEDLIYKNAYIQNLHFLPKYFTQNQTAGSGKFSNMYRPILLTTFAIDYFLWKGKPFGFHLTSIILHALNGIWVFLLVKIVFKNRLLAFLTAVFFIVHPVQSEAVAYASGRTDLLYTFFYLTSLIFFIKSLETKVSLKTFWYLGSLLGFVLALLSKETAVTLPFILIVILYLKNTKTFRVQNFWRWLLPFFLTLGLYFLLRLSTLTFYHGYSFYPVATEYSQNLIIRLYTFCRAFFDYLGMLFFPLELNNARVVPIIKSFLNPAVIIFVMVVSLISFYAFEKRRKNKLFLFCLLWFFITIFPVSGVIPINNTIAERFLYLPSLAFFLLISFLITRLFSKLENFNSKALFSLFLSILFLLLIGRTIIRTFDWRDAVTFYTRSLKQAPWHITMRHNLAMAYQENGRLDLALKEYEKLLTFPYVYPMTYHNLGTLYMNWGRYQEAEKYYFQALAVDPQFYFSYYALLDLYQKMSEEEKAKTIRKKLQNEPDLDKVYNFNKTSL
ncbi:tetratricopeptide repeat protein [Candidatus Gottesmanbacteria bacterium]|nr:tetratricopeptide repeat protein [Candidatus Gottesmanbacteria bacterium]